jgi:hypothetical protein
LVHDQGDGLTINFGDDYAGGVTIVGVRMLDVTGDLRFKISHHDEVLLEGGNPPDETLQLADVVKTLRQQIAGLEARLKSLEANP